MRTLAQNMHFVNLLPPVSAAGGKTSGVINMKNYDHATIALQFGVTSAALAKVQLLASDNGSPEGTEAIPFDVFKCETAYNAANGDVLGARTACAAADGFVPSGDDNVFYVLEVDAAALPEGKKYLKLTLADNSPAASSVLTSAIAILSCGRYAGDQSETVLA